MTEGLGPRFGPPFNEPSVQRCANHWAEQLRQRGITWVAAEDLLQEAWLLSSRDFDAGTVQRPIAFACTVIRNAALGRMRKLAGATDNPADPSEGALSIAPSRHDSFEDLPARRLADETIDFLTVYREAVMCEATTALGPVERAESVWRAAVLATEALLLGQIDPTWGLRETLTWAMSIVDEWWRADGAPGEPITTVMERRRKRTSRSLPWVSFLTVWVALRRAKADHRDACVAMARAHLRHIGIVRREARDNAQRREAVEHHIAEVDRYIAEFEQAPETA